MFGFLMICLVMSGGELVGIILISEVLEVEVLKIYFNLSCDFIYFQGLDWVNNVQVEVFSNIGQVFLW